MLDGTPETSVAGPWSVQDENLRRLFGLRGPQPEEELHGPSAPEVVPPPEPFTEDRLRNALTLVATTPDLLGLHDIRDALLALQTTRETLLAITEELHRERRRKNEELTAERLVSQRLAQELEQERKRR